MTEFAIMSCGTALWCGRKLDDVSPTTSMFRQSTVSLVKPGTGMAKYCTWHSSALKGFDWSCGRNSNFYAGDWSEMREIYHFVSYVEY